MPVGLAPDPVREQRGQAALVHARQGVRRDLEQGEHVDPPLRGRLHHPERVGPAHPLDVGAHHHDPLRPGRRGLRTGVERRQPPRVQPHPDQGRRQDQQRDPAATQRRDDHQGRRGGVRHQRQRGEGDQADRDARVGLDQRAGR